ncbi:SusD/RagB family nutrient-binding outer membrane lipoprotein [Ilyomonas limi]|nr:SusD/RagB family nutrient-binding outer membrane lipoprotein [Ilyomonas limi]
MKKLLRYSTVCLLLLTAFGSCKKYLDINKNPNAAEEPPISGLLANTTYNTAYEVYSASNYTSYYVQYLASPNPASDVDIYNTVDPSTTWYRFYNIMTDLYDMRKFAVQKGQTDHVAISDILMALHINMATNLWGDIPYSEAFIGVNNLTPAFDNQQALFDTALNMLDAGITLLQPINDTTIVDSTSDFIHNGQTSAWLKTAHALKARMLNQLSKTNSYSPDAVLAELQNAYTSNRDDAQVTSFEVRNPWAQVALDNAGLDLDGWLSAYFVGVTKDSIYDVFDPRLPLIGTITRYGDYRGTPNGKGRTGTGTENKESYLAVGGWYSSDNSPLQIITYSECKFIEAEAQFRKGNKNTAYAAYMEGITANMEKMGVAETAITDYTTNPVVAVGADALTLQRIMAEKYVACFLSPVTWDDMRRMDYDYKGFMLPQNAALNTFIRRLSYPVNESSANSAHVPDVQLTDKLWWDQ